MDQQMYALIFRGLTHGITYSDALALMRERGFDSVQDLLNDFLTKIKEDRS